MLVMIWLQSVNGTLHPQSRELARAGARLARCKAGRAVGVYTGPQTAELSLQLNAFPELESVFAYKCDSEDPQVCAAALLCAVKAQTPDILLLGASLEGRAVAPTVAAWCGTGVTADCTALGLSQSGLLIQTRPAFGGNVMAQILTPTARPQMATVRPGALVEGPDGPVGIPSQAKWMVDWQSTPRVLLKQRTPVAPAPAAGVVLAVGGGVKTREDFETLKLWAEKRGLWVMGSRVIVERGWLTQGRQIGLSGQTIQPHLLITVGVSGSAQFMAGVNAPSRLVAVDGWKDAPILKYADLPLITDLSRFVEQLRENQGDF